MCNFWKEGECKQKVKRNDKFEKEKWLKGFKGKTALKSLKEKQNIMFYEKFKRKTEEK